MKKLDKLFIHLFLRNFLLVLPVVLFLLLLQYFVKYFDDFVGKGLGVGIFLQLLSYFAINMLPMALNLGIMLAALMTYGTLGEHGELTAIQASGVSSLRMLRSTFLLVLVLAALGFFANAYFVPRVNLKAFLLLHDIRHKKPAFNLKEHQFYSALPGHSIRIEKKNDEGALKNIMIYEHEEKQSDIHRIITADSGYMRTLDDILTMDLFNGNYYYENRPKNLEGPWNHFLRNQFDEMSLTFSLSSFALQRTAEKYFSNLRYGKIVPELFSEIDSMKQEIDTFRLESGHDVSMFYTLRGHYKGPPIELLEEDIPPRYLSPSDSTKQKDSLDDVFAKEDQLIQAPASYGDRKTFVSRISSITSPSLTKNILYQRHIPYKTTQEKFKVLWQAPIHHADSLEALEQVQYIHNAVRYRAGILKDSWRDVYRHELEAYKRFSLAASCVVMFLIGATAGAIVKKGGLGVPTLVSILFFIVFHVVSILSEKQAREGLMETWIASWMGTSILGFFALLFLWFMLKDIDLLDRRSWGILTFRRKSSQKQTF